MDKKTKEKYLLRKYETAIKIRNFEIDLFWKRALFYWGFITVFIGAYGFLINSENPDNNVYALIISCIGFLLSVAWFLVTFGSKYWQKNWEKIINKLEENPEIGRLFSRTHQNKFHFSVSKLTISISFLMAVVWLSLSIYHLINCFELTQVIIVFSALILFVLMLYYSVGSDTDTLKNDELFGN